MRSTEKVSNMIIDKQLLSGWTRIWTQAKPDFAHLRGSPRGLVPYFGHEKVVALANSPAVGLERDGNIMKIYQEEIHQAWWLNVKEEGQA